MFNKPCLLVFCIFVATINARTTILDVLRSTPELANFNQYITAPSNVRLYNFLSDPNVNVTIFAPVNTAFEQWRQLATGSNLPMSDLQISNALDFHVIPQQLVLNRDLMEGFQQYPTMYNLYNTAGYQQDWRMNRVGSFEVPQDLTRGLTIYGNRGVVDIFRGLGNPAHFIQSDITAVNGIIHMIDQVLTPPDSVWNTLQLRGLTKLIEIIKLANAIDTFRSLSRATFLAPTNEAWTQFLAVHPDMTPELLRNVLLNHIIPGSYLSQDLVTRPSFRMLTKMGARLQFATNPQGEMTVGDASIVMPDILTDSAVLHVINKVLMPGQLCESCNY